MVKCPAVICIDFQIVWQKAQPRPSGGEEMHDSATRREPGRLVIDGRGQSKARDKREAGGYLSSSGQRGSGEHSETEEANLPCKEPRINRPGPMG